MNNLYHKVAVASVCTALSFALGANKKAEAATFSIYYEWVGFDLTFSVIDGGSYGSFDGLGDTVVHVSYNNDPEAFPPHSWSGTERTDAREVAALLEFRVSPLVRSITAYRGESARITRITHAVLQIGVSQPTDSAVMGAFGYVGNGIPEASDFEAGVFLDSKEITTYYGDYYDFNVTPFIQEIFNNNNEFGGFALRSLNQNQIVLPTNRGPAYNFPPRLIVSGEIEEGVEPEPVPEPTTIFGSAIALGVGGWLKRKKSSQQNKTTSQN